MWMSVVLLVELVLIYTAGSRVSSRILGWGLRCGGWRRVVAWACLAPGTAIHETSHLIVVLLLGGKPIHFAPFSPQAQEDGRVQLGVVEHTQVRGGPLGGALVGMAPLIGVPTVVWLSGILMAGPGSPWQVLSALTHTPWGIPWIVFCCTLSLGALPSPSDHRDLPWAAIIILPALSLCYWMGWIPDRGIMLDIVRWLSGLLLVPALVGVVGWMWPSPHRRY